MWTLRLEQLSSRIDPFNNAKASLKIPHTWTQTKIVTNSPQVQDTCLLPHQSRPFILQYHFTSININSQFVNKLLGPTNESATLLRQEVIFTENTALLSEPVDLHFATGRDIQLSTERHRLLEAFASSLV